MNDDARECEHKWRRWEEFPGVEVCRDCGAQRQLVELDGPSAFDVQHMKDILAGMGDWWSARFLRLCAHSDRTHLEALRRAAPAHVAAFERWQREGS
jgi:hypothetical protein